MEGVNDLGERPAPMELSDGKLLEGARVVGQTLPWRFFTLKDPSGKGGEITLGFNAGGEPYVRLVSPTGRVVRMVCGDADRSPVRFLGGDLISAILGCTGGEEEPASDGEAKRT